MRSLFKTWVLLISAFIVSSTLSLSLFLWIDNTYIKEPIFAPASGSAYSGKPHKTVETHLKVGDTLHVSDTNLCFDEPVDTNILVYWRSTNLDPQQLKGVPPILRTAHYDIGCYPFMKETVVGANIVPGDWELVAVGKIIANHKEVRIDWNSTPVTVDP